MVHSPSALAIPDVMTISVDTGISSTDLITKTSTQTVTGTYSGDLATGDYLVITPDSGDTNFLLDQNGEVWKKTRNETTYTQVDSSIASLDVATKTWTVTGTELKANYDWAFVQARVYNQAGGYGGTAQKSYYLDTIAPVATVTTTTVLLDAPITTAKSSELGYVYLVSSTATVTDMVSLDALVNAGAATKAAITTVNSNTSISTTGLHGGDYKLYALDKAGNVSAIPSVGTVSLIVPPPTIALATDTGSSNSDKVTSDATLTLGSLRSGATVEYSANGTDGWATTFTPVQGSNTVYVRQVDGDGTASAPSTAFTFTYDAAAPTIAVSSDKSALKAGETAVLTFTLSESSSDLTADDVTVTGGTLTNFTGRGTSYSATFTPTVSSTADGVISVASGQFSDAAGNLNADGSDTNNQVTMMVDSAIPSAPEVSLTEDNGPSNTDKITNNGALTISGAETNAVVEYSTDGTTWSVSFTPAEGSNTVYVRQTDVAGNVSAASSAYTFTLDTSSPAAPAVALTTDTGISATDRVSRNGALTVSGAEPNATVEYSIDNATWGSSFSPVSGDNTVYVRQLDAAGNPSAATTFIFRLDTPPVNTVLPVSPSAM